jgi:hypothetical protein
MMIAVVVDDARVDRVLLLAHLMELVTDAPKPGRSAADTVSA